MNGSNSLRIHLNFVIAKSICHGEPSLSHASMALPLRGSRQNALPLRKGGNQGSCGIAGYALLRCPFATLEVTLRDAIVKLQCLSWRYTAVTFLSGLR